MIEVLGNISTILHREFCREYIQKVLRATVHNITESPDWNLKLELNFFEYIMSLYKEFY